MKKIINSICLLATMFSFMAVSAQNTASQSGTWTDCLTWGSPTSIIQNISDTKTINNGVTVTQNASWSTNNVVFNGNGAINFNGTSNSIDFVTDLGNDLTCGPSPIVTLQCGAGVLTGSIMPGVPVGSGVSVAVSYRRGNGASYGQGLPIPSTGVTGLTATLRAGTVITGGTAARGNIYFDIAGTASSAGDALFTFDFFGTPCSFKITVGSGYIDPTNNTVHSGSFIYGMYGNNTNHGYAFKGSSIPNILANYCNDTNGGTVTLVYHGGNGGTYPAATIPINSPTQSATLTIAGGTLNVGDGFIVATVSGGTAKYCAPASAACDSQATFSYFGTNWTVNIRVYSVLGGPNNGCNN